VKSSAGKGASPRLRFSSYELFDFCSDVWIVVGSRFGHTFELPDKKF
jgi:hypothetical protein